MKNQRTFFATACAFALLAVVFGAFGAHTLKEKISTDLLTTFETGVRYQFYHSFALLFAGILFVNYQNKFIQSSGIFFCIGIIFFSGSVYLLSIRELIGFENYKWLGPITPLGGLCFIAGWILLFIGVLRK